MTGRAVATLMFSWVLACSDFAHADALVLSVRIDSGPLLGGLKALERQTGAEILYDAGVVRKVRCPAVVGRLSTEAALQQLLTESDLTIRRASSGAWIIEPKASPPLAQPDAAVAEILVIGRHTQNADIRRFENDIQPYNVVTGPEVERAHRDNIDQYFNSRITTNTTKVAYGPTLNADTNSSIDLRGLGPEVTLVLIDGRRMPAIPLPDTDFGQSDINAVPLRSIQRIEVLTGAAGGIHGFGALGGVVNVVLDRDTRGFDIHLTQGISSRGDSRRHGVEANWGHTFNDGATDFVLSASYDEADTPLAGERVYSLRNRRKMFELVPQLYEFPHGNSITVQGVTRVDPETGELIDSPDLLFKPEYGGGHLPSTTTYLPARFSGGMQELVATLTGNAGQIDFSLPEPAASTDLGVNPRSNAVLANLRHRFGERFEIFADAVLLASRGESDGGYTPYELGYGFATITPGSPANPFVDTINLLFPVEHLRSGHTRRYESDRYTAGILAGLPFEWRGTAESSWGSFRREQTFFLEVPPFDSLVLTGDASDPVQDPFRDWDSLQQYMSSDTTLYHQFNDTQSQFRNHSLRLAGPIFRTPAGPATLTLLAERRKDSVPAYRQYQFEETSDASQIFDAPVAAYSKTTTSYYAELRTALADDTAPRLLRQLEIQVALRRDEESNNFARNPRAEAPEFLRADFGDTAYTIGAKISPASWLSIRGSYATGAQPPPLEYLAESDPSIGRGFSTADPQRGGTGIGSEAPFYYLAGGNADLKASHAATNFVGVVLTPAGDNGLRFSIDYSRIRRTRDVMSVNAEILLAHEDFWLGRVQRAPLTDEDRANGYTAGRVTLLDARVANGARVEVECVDLRSEWALPMFGGYLKLYADATYHMKNRIERLFQADVERAGFHDGPLQRRANGGFDWTRDDLTLGANLQYFGSNLITVNDQRPDVAEMLIERQGSIRIPSQTYLDIYGSWRLPTNTFRPVKAFTLDFGVVNVLDKTPPFVSSFVMLGPGYSRYGDPRMRRFELTLSASF